MNRAHALTLSLAATTRVDPLDLARRAIVLACGAALILAGQSIPF